MFSMHTTHLSNPICIKFLKKKNNSRLQCKSIEQRPVPVNLTDLETSRRLPLLSPSTHLCSYLNPVLLCIELSCPITMPTSVASDASSVVASHFVGK